MENDEITSNRTLINKEIESFYANMYTSKIDETRISQQNIPFEDFIEGLNIPQLSKEEQEHLDQDLTCKELKDALSSFADNKTPGEDGLIFFGKTYSIHTTKLLERNHFPFLREGV